MSTSAGAGVRVGRLGLEVGASARTNQRHEGVEDLFNWLDCVEVSENPRAGLRRSDTDELPGP